MPYIRLQYTVICNLVGVVVIFVAFVKLTSVLHDFIWSAKDTARWVDNFSSVVEFTWHLVLSCLRNSLSNFSLPKWTPQCSVFIRLLTERWFRSLESLIVSYCV